MIKTILELLPYLFAVISANIMLGTFYSVKTLKKDFSKDKMIEGLWKAFVISYGFISLAIVSDKIITLTDLTTIDFLPNALIIASIVLYLGKASKSLADILQVTKVIVQPSDEVIER